MKAPAKDIVRVGGGNIYFRNPNTARAVKVAAGTRPHSWGWSEGSRAVNVRPVPKGMEVLEAFGANNRVDANDCAMMVRKGLDVVHFSMTKACDQADGTRVGQERWFSMLAYRAPMLGKNAVLCHIAIHPNWVVGFDGKSSKVVREYVKSMQVLRSMLAYAKSMGWIIVVTGDFNTRQGQPKPFTTVYDIFADAGLRVRTEGIDGVAWDKRLVVVEWTTIGKARTGSDHDFWIAVDFRKR